MNKNSLFSGNNASLSILFSKRMIVSSSQEYVLNHRRQDRVQVTIFKMVLNCTQNSYIADRLLLLGFGVHLDL